MIRVARRAATALLIGTALVLTLAFSTPAGAADAPDETATTSIPTTQPEVTTTTASPVTSTTAAAAPVTTSQIVRIGTAASVQSITGVQRVNAVPVNAGARTVRTLPATGSSSLPLARAGFGLVLVGMIAIRSQRSRFFTRV